jgi:hypothetical protein
MILYAPSVVVDHDDVAETSSACAATAVADDDGNDLEISSSDIIEVVVVECTFCCIVMK